jgi:WD40 repeat protein
MKNILLCLLVFVQISVFAQKPQFVIQSGLQTDAIAADISPDNRLALTVEMNETCVLWDLQTGKQLQSFKNIIFANFSKDGSNLEVIGSDYTFRTLDFSGIIVEESPIKNKGADKFSRNLSSRYYNESDLLLVSGRLYSKYQGQFGKIISTENHFSEKLNLIATRWERDTIYLIETTSFTTDKVLIFDNLSWSTNWNSETNIEYVQFSPDGKLLMAGHNESLEIKELATGKSVFSIQNYQQSDEIFIHRACFSPDSKKLLLFCTDKIVLIDLATKKEIWKNTDKFGIDQYTRGAISFSNDGKQVMVGKNQKLLNFDVATGSIVSKLSGIVQYPVSYHQLLADNLVLVQNTKALNWNLLTGELKKITPMGLPLDSGNKYRMASNAKATKFYKYLDETDEKTEVVRPFQTAGDLEYQPKILSISTDEKRILHCAEFKDPNSKSDLKISAKLVVSEVQTSKILWQKEGISMAQFNNKGSLIAAGIYNRTADYSDKFYLLDEKTGNIVKTIPVLETFENVRKFVFSKNDTYLYARTTSGIVLLEMATGKTTELDVPIPNTEQNIENAIFTPDEKTLIFSDFKGGLHFYNIAQKRFEPEKYFTAHLISVEAMSVTSNGRFLFTNAKESFVKVWDLKTRTIVATLHSDSDNGDWAVVTPEGRFDGTKKMQESMYFVKETVIIPLDGLFEQFYTPHLLTRILEGEKFEPIALKIEDLKAVPTVKILVENKQRGFVPVSDVSKYLVDNEQITLQIKAECPNDLVSEIRLFQNGKLVGSTRNLVVEDDTPTGEKTMLKTFTLTLNMGENQFSAVAFNSQRSESKPDAIIVQYAPKTPPKVGSPTSGTALYLVVVGINKYKNSKYNLNYATADATAFQKAIENGGKSIFSKTNVIYIGDDKATKSGIAAELEKVKLAAQPQDVFIFYYAGHGVMNDKKAFYLVPHDVTQLYGADDALEQKGLSASQLQQFSKELKAQKQLFILDACQSAAALDAVAMRGAAEEKAISQLARATGTHWLTASGSEQFASEFVQLGHGTFTYVLLEALSGKADLGGDGKITVKELDAYLQENVPILTEKYKGTAQWPASYGYGNDFPIGVKE